MADYNETKKSTQRIGLSTKAIRAHSDITSGALEDRDNLWRRWSVYFYRYMLLFMKGINRTELPRRAAALTYTTILSLFPLLAVMSAFVGFFYTTEKEDQFAQYLQTQFFPSAQQAGDELPLFLSPEEREKLTKQDDKLQELREFFSNASNKFRDNAGGVGVFGFIGLLITAGLLYYSIESVVNQTWQLEHSAQWNQTLTNFITILVLAPIIIGISITTTTLAVTLFGAEPPPMNGNGEEPELVEQAAIPDSDFPEAITPDIVGPSLPTDQAVTPMVASTETPKEQPVAVPKWLRKVRSVTTHFGFFLKIVPGLVNALILAIAYGFLPKTKVKFKYALLGGLVAGILWELAKNLFVFYVWISSINQTLAEAFGVAVIFLIWIYFTWLILLIGNLIVYTSQNFRELWTERITGRDGSVDSRLYLAVMLLMARRFSSIGGGYTEMDLRLRLGLSGPNFHHIIEPLIKGGYIILTKDSKYQLNHPPNQVMAKELLLQGCNLKTLPIAVRKKGLLSRLFDNLEDRAVGICGDMTLEDLLNEARLNDSMRDSEPEGVWTGKNTPPEKQDPNPAKG